MNLDDPSLYAKIDPSNMILQIDGLPDQLQMGWNRGMSLPLPSITNIKAICLAGMGGSAIAGELIQAYISGEAPIPFFIHRDYNLPAWAYGAEVLVISSSHSGNTEETLSAFDEAAARGCSIVALTRGGELGRKAANCSTSVLWTFEHEGQPRAAVAITFGMLLALVYRLGLIRDPAGDVEDAVAMMRKQRLSLQVAQPAHANPAKRLAGQMVGRAITIFGSGFLAPVARRWKGQYNELAKAIASFESLPEANHNTQAGVDNPPESQSKHYLLFLKSAQDHPINHRRASLTQKQMMLEGFCVDTYHAIGKSKMEHLWTAVQFGDYTAYYLALAYGVDPSPVEAIESIKQELG